MATTSYQKCKQGYAGSQCQTSIELQREESFLVSLSLIQRILCLRHGLRSISHTQAGDSIQIVRRALVCE